MITPTSGSITTTPQTFDGIWLSNIQINAPTPVGKISANIRAIPFNSASGSLAPINYAKNIFIPDIMTLAASSSLAANAMGAMFNFIQDYVVSKSIF